MQLLLCPVPAHSCCCCFPCAGAGSTPAPKSTHAVTGPVVPRWTRPSLPGWRGARRCSSYTRERPGALRQGLLPWAAVAWLGAVGLCLSAASALQVRVGCCRRTRPRSCVVSGALQEKEEMSRNNFLPSPHPLSRQVGRYLHR